MNAINTSLINITNIIKLLKEVTINIEWHLIKTLLKNSRTIICVTEYFTLMVCDSAGQLLIY